MSEVIFWIQKLISARIWQEQINTPGKAIFSTSVKVFRVNARSTPSKSCETRHANKRETFSYIGVPIKFSK